VGQAQQQQVVNWCLQLATAQLVAVVRYPLARVHQNLALRVQSLCLLVHQLAQVPVLSL
jgi:hypothetical protein